MLVKNNKPKKLKKLNVLDKKQSPTWSGMQGLYETQYHHKAYLFGGYVRSIFLIISSALEMASVMMITVKNINIFWMLHSV
jgi:hypothetical protein